MENQAFIGRQPILDTAQHVIGYELFYRHNAEAQIAMMGAGDLKTESSVLMNAIGEMDVQGLLGGKLAFINVNEAMLKSEFLELMPSERTVLELLNEITLNESVIERCQNLRKQGYKIALDNPHLRAELPLFTQLLQCADYIKVDVLNLNAEEIQNIFTRLSTDTLKMVAEKVETAEQLAVCENIGFQMFQGYYFSRPETFKAKVVNASFDSVLNLLNLVGSSLDNRVVEVGFKHDSILAYKLLRYINSVGFGLSCEIQSINHALTILGRPQLNRWLTLLMATAGENATSPELMQASITRGRIMSLLGESYFDEDECEKLFMTGAFSLLDEIMQLPMEQVLEKVNLSHEISDALINHTGVYSPFLKLAKACEQGDRQRIQALADSLAIDADDASQCYVAAQAWAVETIG